MKKFVFVLATCLMAATAGWAQTLTGTVTCEGQPVAGVCVSDGVEVVRTDVHGCYAIQSAKEQGFVFVITPSGYTVPLRERLTPAFWARLTEPADVAENHDFVLEKQKQDNYTVIFTTDLHLQHSPKLNDFDMARQLVVPLAQRLYAENSKKGPVVTFQLGDLVQDRYWYQYDMDPEKARVFLRDSGFTAPLYSVMGNHDHDGARLADEQHPDITRYAEEPWREAFGPTYYSMNIGNDHWVMLDNILYYNEAPPRSGEGKYGMKGNRRFEVGLTEGQFAWLEKDLAMVPAGTKIRVCGHASFILPKTIGKDTEFADPAQVDRLYKMLRRFGPVNFYNGHAHRMYLARNPRYPDATDFTITATSGNIWNTGADKMQSMDAIDGGILIGRFGKGEPSYAYETYLHGSKQLRAYDMNTVRANILENKKAQERIAEFDYCTDYSTPDRENQVYVNAWMLLPGYTLEMYEGSHKLDVEQVVEAEPLSLAGNNGKSFFTHKSYVQCYHLYKAQASKPNTTITIKVLDARGKVVYKEKMKRPKAFSLDME